MRKQEISCDLRLSIASTRLKVSKDSIYHPKPKQLRNSLVFYATKKGLNKEALSQRRFLPLAISFQGSDALFKRRVGGSELLHQTTSTTQYAEGRHLVW